jgi:hypothetical protein
MMSFQVKKPKQKLHKRIVAKEIDDTSTNYSINEAVKPN